MVTRSLMARGDAFDVARRKALASIAGAVQAQSAMIAYERVFLLFGVVFLLAIPLILSLKWDPTRLRGGADAH